MSVVFIYQSEIFCNVNSSTWFYISILLKEPLIFAFYFLFVAYFSSVKLMFRDVEIDTYPRSNFQKNVKTKKYLER
eukprot:UN24370